MSGGAVVMLRCPCPDTRCAAGIADAALAARLAAAATLSDGESRYRWQGTLHAHPETVLILTTVEDRRAALCDLVARLHPYELPAITWVVAGATAATAHWAQAACAADVDET